METIPDAQVDIVLETSVYTVCVYVCVCPCALALI